MSIHAPAFVVHRAEGPDSMKSFGFSNAGSATALASSSFAQSARKVKTKNRTCLMRYRRLGVTEWKQYRTRPGVVVAVDLPNRKVRVTSTDGIEFDLYILHTVLDALFEPVEHQKCTRCGVRLLLCCMECGGKG